MFDLQNPYITKGLRSKDKSTNSQAYFVAMKSNSSLIEIILSFRAGEDSASLSDIVSSIIDEHKFYQLYDFIERIWISPDKNDDGKSL